MDPKGNLKHPGIGLFSLSTESCVSSKNILQLKPKHPSSKSPGKKTDSSEDARCSPCRYP